MKMNEFNYMSAALELFAATVTAVMLVGCFLERKHRTKTGKFLVGVLIAHTSMLLVDAPIWLLLAKPAAENVVWVKILSFFVDTFLCALISLYTYCLTAYISEKKKISYRYANIITVLCGVALLLWLISTFNGMYIYYDETGLDQTGHYYLLSQAFDVVLPAMTMVLAFRYHDAIGWLNTWILVLYGLIPVLSIPVQVLWAVTPVCLATTVSLVLVYTLIHVEQAECEANIEKELAQKELALSESNNSLVLSQIQPHFLYNALTSIYRLCDVKPEAAKEAVGNFSKYLRGNLDSIKQTKMISFADELHHLEAYLSLEKICYDDDLDIKYDIKATEFFIPPLTVQPLVENAVNHGISDMPHGGCVTISTEEMPDRYEIRVRENSCEIAFLDIKMRGMTGIELARQLKDIQGDINIIFVTGYSEYSLNAFRLYASDYLLKSATPDAVRQALGHLRTPVRPTQTQKSVFSALETLRHLLMANRSCSREQRPRSFWHIWLIGWAHSPRWAS